MKRRIKKKKKGKFILKIWFVIYKMQLLLKDITGSVRIINHIILFLDQIFGNTYRKLLPSES